MKGKAGTEGGGGKGRLGSGETPSSSQPPALRLSGPPASSHLPTPQPRMLSLPPSRASYREAGEQLRSAMENSMMAP